MKNDCLYGPFHLKNGVSFAEWGQFSVIVSLWSRVGPETFLYAG